MFDVKMTDIILKIKQEQVKGRQCPFLVCEICGKNIIQTEKNGMFFWNDEKGVLAHKSCMEKHPDNRSYISSYELESFFFNTLHNSKVTPKEDELCI